MKNHLFARVLRAAGRLLLFVGAVFDLGLIALAIYAIIYRIYHPNESIPDLFGATPVSDAVRTTTNTGNPNPVLTIAITVGAILFTLALIILAARIYNNSLRKYIAKLAKFFHITIFGAEVVFSLIIWTLATIILLFIFPVASIITIFALIATELCFIFAWTAYGQPNYKL